VHRLVVVVYGIVVDEKTQQRVKPFRKGVERNSETLVALGNLGETRLGNFSPIILPAKTQRYQKVPAVSAETFNTFVERLARLEG
jgi:hypothetical protein